MGIFGVESQCLFLFSKTQAGIIATFNGAGQDALKMMLFACFRLHQVLRALFFSEKTALKQTELSKQHYILLTVKK
jgi:hypothetical protein